MARSTPSSTTSSKTEIHLELFACSQRSSMDPIAVHELDLDGAEAKGMPIDLNSKLLKDDSKNAITKIAACYSAKENRNYVAYQLFDGSVQLWDSATKQGGQ